MAATSWSAALSMSALAAPASASAALGKQLLGSSAELGAAGEACVVLRRVPGGAGYVPAAADAPLAAGEPVVAIVYWALTAQRGHGSVPPTGPRTAAMLPRRGRAEEPVGVRSLRSHGLHTRMFAARRMS